MTPTSCDPSRLFRSSFLRHQARARGAIAEHNNVDRELGPGSLPVFGQGPSFLEFLALTLHAWASSRRLGVGSALMDFPTFSWASLSS